MLKKLRFFYLLGLTFLRRNSRTSLRISVFLIVLLIVLQFTAGTVLTPFKVKFFSTFSKVSFSEGVIGQVKSLNPLFETTEVERDLNRLIFRGLMKNGGDGKMQPDLAESFEILSSTEYLFKLKTNIYWHDGKKFSADDVVYTIKAVLDPNLSTTAKKSFKDIVVEKLDDHTIKFSLKEPFAPFLEETTLGIIPQHIPLSRYRPIGTGEFKVSYFGQDKVVLTNEKVDLVFKQYPTLETAVLALKQGEIKSLGGLNFPQLQQFKDYPNLNLNSFEEPNRIVGIFFNTKADFVKDKLLRQALAFATPKSELAELSGDSNKLANGPLTEKNSLDLKTKDKFLFELEKSGKLLDSLGWKLKNELREKEGEPLKITLTVLEEEPFPSLGKKIGETWKKLGVDFQLIALQKNEIAEAIRGTQFQAVLTTVEVSSDPDQYVLWHSTQIGHGNITNLSSAKIDKLLEDGRKTNSLNLRKEKYVEFLRIIADESPAIFLYYPNYNWLYSSRYGEIKIDDFVFPSDRFRNASAWKISKFSL